MSLSGPRCKRPLTVIAIELSSLWVLESDRGNQLRADWEAVKLALRAQGNTVVDGVAHQIGHAQRHSGFASFRWCG